MQKLTYIISDIDKALAFEWVAAYLDEQKFELNFILLNSGESHLEKFLVKNGIRVNRIYLNKGWKMLFSLFSLWFLLLKTKPDIIHTHLRYASLLGITAGYLTGIKKRIHTRHHAASNHIYYPHAVKHDKYISRLSTHIVSISDVVSDVLINWEEIRKEKINKIPHGFKLSFFENTEKERIEHLREKLNIPTTVFPIIGVISRFMTLKGIDYIIEAFKTIRLSHPNAHIILANANGPDAKKINKQLSKLPPSSLTTIIFEQDIAALYQLFDIFIHVPISKHSEAFGQTYIEALASGTPSIFTQAGIACECIIHEHNAIVVAYRDSTAISDAINRIISDDALQLKLISNGKKTAKQFDLPIFIDGLQKLYANA